MCTPQPAAGHGRIRLNVGGQVFETTTDTLTGAGQGTMLGAMMDPSWNAGTTGGAVPEHFIDRDPACFASLLDMLRTGELHVSLGVPERVLFREALYYGLLDRVRAARIGEFDIDRIRLAASLPPGRVPVVRPAVRAAPDGGCCVTHGRGATVRIYNWMLEERRPVCLSPTVAWVRDAAYLNASTLLVGGLGMAAFSTLTGDLSHKFRVAHEGQERFLQAGALAFDQQTQIFASCRDRQSNYDGIGIWDCITGEQIGSFFYDQPAGALGDANKLQWLASTNALMAVTTSSPEYSWQVASRADTSSITLVDFRDMSVVWSWSGGLGWKDKRVVDAVVMEDERSVCLISQYHDLAFLDIRLRSDAGAVKWDGRHRREMTTSCTWTCYPKLAVHGGLVLASKDDTILVLGGPYHDQRLALRGSQGGGGINDFSVGGDRLFAVHEEDNVWDVWETPPPPII